MTTHERVYENERCEKCWYHHVAEDGKHLCCINPKAEQVEKGRPACHRCVRSKLAWQANVQTA